MSTFGKLGMSLVHNARPMPSMAMAAIDAHDKKREAIKKLNRIVAILCHFGHDVEIHPDYDSHKDASVCCKAAIEKVRSYDEETRKIYIARLIEEYIPRLVVYAAAPSKEIVASKGL